MWQLTWPHFSGVVCILQHRLVRLLVLILNAFTLFNFFTCSLGDLVISVKNQGGDVVEETLYANVTKDIVILEFQRSDGTLVTQLSDFTNEVLVLRALVLGEEERGQNQYQVLCFILADQTSDLIPSEAISKLRQKNPGALRVPEEDRGKEAFDFNLQMSPSEGGMLSPLLEDFCSEAQHSTYLREQDWIGWQEQRAHNEMLEMPTVLNHFLNETPPRCDGVKDWSQPCVCHFYVQIPWYPCGLKYCQGKDSSGKVQSYRCGIRTCKRTYAFTYGVFQKQQCLWDE